MTKCPRPNCGGQVVLLWADGGEIPVCLQCSRTIAPEATVITEAELQRDNRAENGVLQRATANYHNVR